MNKRDSISLRGIGSLPVFLVLLLSPLLLSPLLLSACSSEDSGSSACCSDVDGDSNDADVDHIQTDGDVDWVDFDNTDQVQEADSEYPADSDSADTMDKDSTDSMPDGDSDSMDADYADSDMEIAEEDEPQFLYFRLTPLSGGQIQTVGVVNPLPVQIRLPFDRVRTVSGTVTRVQNGSPKPVKGRIVFEPTGWSQLPSPLRKNAVSANFEDDGYYTVQLTRGIYHVYIYPELETLPPYISARSLAVEDQDIVADYNLGDPDSYPRASVQIFTKDLVEVNGLKARAYNTDMMLVSAEAVVYLQSFNLRMPRVDGVDYTLEIIGRFDVGGQVIPKRVYPNAVRVVWEPNPDLPDGGTFKTLLFNEHGENVDPLILDYRNTYLGACNVSGKLWSHPSPSVVCGIEGGGEQADCKPVKNFVISLWADTPTGNVTRSITVAGAESGEFSVSLYPGFYSMLIVPDTSELATATLTALDCTAITHGVTNDDLFDIDLEMTLTERVAFIGTIQTPDAVMLPAAEMYATYLPFNPANTTFVRHATSGDVGDFSLLLDPGVYNIAVIPPAGATAAWFVDIRHTMVANTRGDLLLPAGRMIEGDVVYSDTGDLAGSLLVEIFIITPDGDTMQIGSTTSNEAGHFSVMAPAQFLLRSY